jgi:hypothetical protein
MTCTRTDYFLRNVFLNFRFRAKSLIRQESTEAPQSYGFVLLMGERIITVRISRTVREGTYREHVLTNVLNNKVHRMCCHYGVEGVSEVGQALMRRSDSMPVASFEERGAEIDLRIGINLVDETFRHLSALEEYQRTAEARRDRGSYWADESSDDVNEPLVDDLYILFADTLNTVFASTGISNSLERKAKTATICLTHDVDALRKNKYTSLRYLSFLSAGALKKGDPGLIKKMMRYMSMHSDFNQIGNITGEEAAFGFASTFFVYSKVGKRGALAGLRSALIDPAYDVANDKVLGAIKRAMDLSGIEVGLHCSYSAATDGDSFRQEMAALETCISGPVLSARNHFLNFSVINTPLIQERAGIRCDATFYYNNVNGFLRHKTCSPFYFYSHTQNRALEVVEIPTVLMDATLYNYSGLSDADAFEESKTILDKVRERNGVACINWHNETAAPEYQWHNSYKATLEWMKTNGVSGCAIRDTYRELVSEDHNGSVINAG